MATRAGNCKPHTSDWCGKTGAKHLSHGGNLGADPAAAKRRTAGQLEPFRRLQCRPAGRCSSETPTGWPADPWPAAATSETALRSVPHGAAAPPAPDPSPDAAPSSCLCADNCTRRACPRRKITEWNNLSVLMFFFGNFSGGKSQVPPGGLDEN